MGEFTTFLQNNLADFWTYTGFYNATPQHIIMLLVGIGFYLLSRSQGIRADASYPYRIWYTDR